MVALPVRMIHPARRRKLLVILLLLLVLSVAIACVLYALRQNISLFYTPTQIAMNQAPHDRLIRAGGVVVPGSVLRGQKGLSVSFEITDYRHTIEVHYTGILPDLFREKQGIVAEGYLRQSPVFQAQTVLAKHDENYMPPEVRSALKYKKESA
jgi:cytochrome c-type biogenesis protein CcmE